jgi:hypothetical protein
VIAFVLAAAIATADAPTLAAVLGRAASYVAEFERQLSGIVGEELYRQQARSLARKSGQPGVPIATELKSDLLLVRTNASLGYVQYRDVFEVDGRPVRDRKERLTLLLSRQTPAGENEVRRILEDNARFNVGDVIRTMNVPLLALEFLKRENQPRFKFKRVTDTRPQAFAADAVPSAAFRLTTEVWVIEYREEDRGTLIRTLEGKDIPARGRLWIEPDTGRVLMTELLTDNKQLRGTVDVSFQSEALLGLLVPVEMRERYDGKRSGSVIECVATYSRFRKFR